MELAEAQPLANEAMSNQTDAHATANEQKTLQFPQGLLGFEDTTRFILTHDEGAQTVLYLQACDEPELMFPVVDPDQFQVNYQLKLSDDEIALLQLAKPEDAAVLVTVSRDESPLSTGVHANFLAPIVINTQARIGLQKPLNTIHGSVVIAAE